MAGAEAGDVAAAAEGPTAGKFCISWLLFQFLLSFRKRCFFSLQPALTKRVLQQKNTTTPRTQQHSSDVFQNVRPCYQLAFWVAAKNGIAVAFGVHVHATSAFRAKHVNRLLLRQLHALPHAVVACCVASFAFALFLYEPSPCTCLQERHLMQGTGIHLRS